MKELQEPTIQNQNPTISKNIILQKTLVNPSDFILYYLHFKNVEHNAPHNRQNRYSDNYSELIQSPHFQSLELPFPNVTCYIYGVLSFLRPFWYDILQPIFHLPCYKTAIACRHKIQELENFSLDMLKPKIFLKDNLLKQYIE